MDSFNFLQCLDEMAAECLKIQAELFDVRGVQRIKVLQRLQTELHTVRQLFRFQDVCVVWRHLTVRQHALLYTEWLITPIDEELTKAAGPALVEEASRAWDVKDDLTVDPDPSIRRGTKKRLRLMTVNEI